MVNFQFTAVHNTQTYACVGIVSWNDKDDDGYWRDLTTKTGMGDLNQEAIIIEQWRGAGITFIYVTYTWLILDSFRGNRDNRTDGE